MYSLQFILFYCGAFKSTINNGNTIFVTHALKTFYRVWSSPYAWRQGGKIGMPCSALVPIYSHQERD